MARPLRLEYAGALYHVTSRGDRQEDIYEDDRDRKMFLTLLEHVCETLNWNCHAYCLMDNHYHLLVETPDTNLCRGMRQLNGRYTQSFNRKHDRTGHVFQGRYKAILVEKQSHLLEVARYIVLNPVRAQIVRFAWDWEWSSYRASAGISDPPKFLATDWLLTNFSRRRNKATELYREFVEEGINQPSPWAKLRNQIYLGSETFVEKSQAHLDGELKLDEIPASQKSPPRKSIEYFQQNCHSRNQAISEAYRNGGYTLKQIGNHFGLHYSSVSGIIKNHKSKT